MYLEQSSNIASILSKIYYFCNYIELQTEHCKSSLENTSINLKWICESWLELKSRVHLEYDIFHYAM